MLFRSRDPAEDRAARVAASGVGNAWTSGAIPQRGKKFTPVIEHWNGHRWAVVTLPPAVSRFWRGGYPFSVVSTSSAADFWAFSQVQGRYLHWDGRTWSTGWLPGGSTGYPLVISSVVQFSPADLRVFGGHLVSTQSGTADAPFVARFNGARWQQARAPAGASAISAVSARSPADVWAVLGRLPMIASGRAAQLNALVHWDGHRWSAIRLPRSLAGRSVNLPAPQPSASASGGASSSPAAIPGVPGPSGASPAPSGSAAPAVLPTVTLSAVVALSDHDVWVGGAYPNSQLGTNEMAAQWNGRQWKVVVLPSLVSVVLYQLTSMVPDGSGGAWAVATNNGLNRSRLWHLAGGKWTGPFLFHPCLRGCVLSGLARVPGTSGAVWAAGSTMHGSSAAALIAVTGALSPSG